METLSQEAQYQLMQGWLNERQRRLYVVARELRRKFRQVGCFSSPTGAELAVYIQVTGLNAQWTKTIWWEASRSLAHDLLNINP